MPESEKIAGTLSLDGGGWPRSRTGTSAGENRPWAFEIEVYL